MFVLTSIWLLMLYLFSVPQWQESYLPLSFSAFCTVPKHSESEWLGKLGHSKMHTPFTFILLKNPVFYYVYSKKKKVYYKMPRETNAFSSPLRVSRSHWFREDKACGSSEGLDGSVGPAAVTSCVNWSRCLGPNTSVSLALIQDSRWCLHYRGIVMMKCDTTCKTLVTKTLTLAIAVAAAVN